LEEREPALPAPQHPHHNTLSRPDMTLLNLLLWHLIRQKCDIEWFPESSTKSHFTWFMGWGTLSFRRAFIECVSIGTCVIHKVFNTCNTCVIHTVCKSYIKFNFCSQRITTYIFFT
jgi:hypothetical protein